MLEIILSWLLAFISQIKPWLVGYVLSEGHARYKWTKYTLMDYIFRFSITLWVLYWASLAMVEYWKDWHIYIFSAWFFSLFILDVYDKFWKDKINNVIKEAWIIK